MSKANDDFPDPERPVMTINLSFGVVRYLDAADSLRLSVPRGAVDEEELDE